jgi:hypothetical protein
MIAFSMGLPIVEITERAEVTRARFANRGAPQVPLVFRGFVTDWPARRWDFPRIEFPRNAPPDWRFDVLGDVPELAAECPRPRVYHGRPEYQLFMGRDTVTRTHYHALHALICQVHGNKRVLLWSPDDSRFLYAHPVYRPHFEVSRGRLRDLGGTLLWNHWRKLGRGLVGVRPT